jgi:hypothetical protein
MRVILRIGYTDLLLPVGFPVQALIESLDSIRSGHLSGCGAGRKFTSSQDEDVSLHIIPDDAIMTEEG